MKWLNNNKTKMKLGLHNCYIDFIVCYQKKIK